MGIFDRFKHSKTQGGGSGTAMMDRARGMLHGHSDQVNKGVDKAGQMVDDRTGHKYTDQINTGTGKAKDMLAEQGERGAGGEPGVGPDMPQPGMGGMPGEDGAQPPQS
ncbi:MAG TPA: antitoxin [Actinocrinis sp.]|uniref:antitoxin n=1 Tax=Actinocrinis sp. TaxID=1920516 RepID=UPI002D3BA475|nr:antitoxin [Actinocrinis sp.]HZU56234.1 antitoxin [Actinocrinis sp.]